MAGADPFIEVPANKPQNLEVAFLSPTPIDISRLQCHAQGYDANKLQFILNGFTWGFQLHYTGPRTARNSKKLRSALAHPAFVSQKINLEIVEQRVAGPFKSPPFENLIVSPIGLVPKKFSDPNTPDVKKFRMIHHLSFPEGESVNDYIDPKLTSVQYTGFDEAVAMIQRLGKNCKLFKMDIKNAFRLIPIRPADFELLGFKHKDQYFFDKVLPFGAAISCSTWETFSTLLEYCVKNKMASGELLHYLDDFLGGDTTMQGCSVLMHLFKSTMLDIKVPIAEEKTEGPTEI